jgi:hypothetical protein
MSNWQRVYDTEIEFRASIVKDILIDSGLNPVVIKKKDRSYNDFGGFEVRVAPEEVIMALKIIGDGVRFE